MKDKKAITPSQKRDPAAVDNLVQRGLKYFKGNAPLSELMRFFDQIDGIPPNNRGSQYVQKNEMIRAKFAHFDLPDIIQALEREARIRSNPRVTKLLGFAYFDAGDLERAISALKEALKTTEEDPVAIYENLARCYILLGDLPSAVWWCSYSSRIDLANAIDKFGVDYAYCWAAYDQQLGKPVFGKMRETQFTKAFEAVGMLINLEMISAIEARSLYTDIKNGRYDRIPGRVAGTHKMNVEYW